MGTELTKQESTVIQPIDADFTSLANFKELYDMGKMLATSTMIPQAYQGKPMDCAIALEMANRMQVSPMMVMQNMYVVKGKPSWSGQACISLINASKRFRDVRHIYTGEKGSDSRGCFVRATRVSDSELVDGTEVTIEMAKAEGWLSNSKWKTMPEQMLAYRAAAFFARVHIPNALMGMHLDDEIIDIQKEALPEVVDPFAEVDE